MTRQILGLDVGGANLKAATPDGRAVSVPFALWKQPDKLPAALAALVGQFPETTELAVTMTGELCDCYETKREGVGAILDAVEFAAGGRPVRVWGAGGEFLSVAASRAEHMTVAAANWHALATFAGRFVPTGPALLIDIGGTTTDIIPLRDGRPCPRGLTDFDRLHTLELIYTGVRRTPACAILGGSAAAELFATTLDAHLWRCDIPEDATDTDTADGRPATRHHAHARLARMLGGDSETVDWGTITQLAGSIARSQEDAVRHAVHAVVARNGGECTFVTSGVGEFLTVNVLGTVEHGMWPRRSIRSDLGPAVSACAPAYAVGVLASERPS